MAAMSHHGRIPHLPESLPSILRIRKGIGAYPFPAVGALPWFFLTGYGIADRLRFRVIALYIDHTL